MNKDFITNRKKELEVKFEELKRVVAQKQIELQEAVNEMVLAQGAYRELDEQLKKLDNENK